MKRCSRCKELKQSEECFNTNGTAICKQCDALRSKIYRKLLRMEFILAYGGCCSCCGESEIDFLTIEHIRNKGHKLIYGTNKQVILKLKSLGWPKEGYIVLCYNCNCSMKMGNPCVHTDKYRIEEQRFKALLTDKERGKYSVLKSRLQTANYKITKVA